MSYSENGCLITSYSVPRELYDYFSGLVLGVDIDWFDNDRSKSYHQFISHVYVSTLLGSIKSEDLSEEMSVPIYSRLIEKEFKHRIDIQLLRDLKIIKFTPRRHSNEDERCREYSLGSNIFYKAQTIVFNNIIKEWNSFFMGTSCPQNVNLFTMRPIITIWTSGMSIHYSESDLEIPDFIKQSLKSIQPCPINPHLVIPYLTKMHDKIRLAHNEFIAFSKEFSSKHPQMAYKEKKNNPSYKAHFQEYSQVQGLFNNILTAIRAISNQKPELNGRKTTDQRDLVQYQAAYTLQSSGRVSEIHGGQSLYTPCKWLLLESVPNIYNYNMKNVTAAILADELTESGYDCPWLEGYIQHPDMKEKLAKKVGISVDCWEDCFYATIMASDAGRSGDILKSIRQEEVDAEKAELKCNKFIKETQELLKACDNWREHLLWGMSGRYMVKDRWFHWQNACGMIFKDFVVINDGYENDIMHEESGVILHKEEHFNEVKRMLAVFFLQGREAFFFHKLTLECAKHDMPVYKNDHDGFITGEKIPSSIIAKVARKIGIPEIRLDIKEICKEEERKRFDEFLEI